MRSSHIAAQELLLKVFLVICVLLPTGSVFGINIKFISLFLLLGSAVVLSRGKGMVKLFAGMIIPVLLIIVFTIITEFQLRLIPETIGQVKDLLVFFLMGAIGYSLIEKDRRYEVITKTIIKALIFVGALKILILFFAIVTGGSVAGVVKGISSFFNTSLMTMETDDVVISRINFMSDYLLPVALYIMTREMIKKGSGAKSIIILLILLVSLTISLSRFLWGMGMLCVMLAVLSDIKKYKSIILILCTFAIVAFLLTLPAVQDLIEFRFSSKGAVESDNIRTRQFEVIYNSFLERPWLGNGLGYYVPSLIRSYLSRYSYELQIPALYMQIGVIGASISMLIILGTLLTQIKGLSVKLTLVYFILIAVWISGGFFNPVIFSSTGGVAFMLLYTVPDYLRSNKKTIEQQR